MQVVLRNPDFGTTTLDLHDQFMELTSKDNRWGIPKRVTKFYSVKEQLAYYESKGYKVLSTRK